VTEFVKVEGGCGGTAAEGRVKWQVSVKTSLTQIIFLIISNKIYLKIFD
jgi:hypothetical protein